MEEVGVLVGRLAAGCVSEAGKRPTLRPRTVQARRGNPVPSHRVAVSVQIQINTTSAEPNANAFMQDPPHAKGGRACGYRRQGCRVWGVWRFEGPRDDAQSTTSTTTTTTSVLSGSIFRLCRCKTRPESCAKLCLRRVPGMLQPQGSTRPRTRRFSRALAYLTSHGSFSQNSATVSI